MNKYIDKNVLITTNNWFYAPDGKQYKCVWGKLIALHEAKDVLGFPIQRSVNWIAEIGNMIIMGCQIHYVIICDNCPPDTVKDHSVKESNVNYYERPSYVYNANQ